MGNSQSIIKINFEDTNHPQIFLNGEYFFDAYYDTNWDLFVKFLKDYLGLE